MDTHLPEDRLATTDSQGNRVYIHTAEVRGKFKNIRKIVHFILMIIFLVAPWIHIGGKPLILLDIVKRHFTIFGFSFWAHDVPILFFVLASFIFGIALLTAVLGRAWCGWACPETVFVESIYRRIEYWVEGTWVQRKKLDDASMSFQKLFKRSLKWGLYLLVTLVISHSFLAYFTGVKKLGVMMGQSPVHHPTPFLIMAFITAILLFAFGWFREQFCIIMCPYGRLQSVLLDDRSLVVAYDKKRGEPRRGTEQTEQEGDCVSCNRCVQVCPTGIDIRRGLQMECVACTLCIDACDEVMEKVKRPKGLIRYDTELSINNSALRANRWHSIESLTRPRVIGYSSFLIILFLVFVLVLNKRELVNLTILRASEMPFQLVQSTQGNIQVINHFRIHVANQSEEEFDAKIELVDKTLEGSVEVIHAPNAFPISSRSDKKVEVFIRFPKSLLQNGSANLKLLIADKTHEVKLLGPFN